MNAATAGPVCPCEDVANAARKRGAKALVGVVVMCIRDGERLRPRRNDGFLRDEPDNEGARRLPLGEPGRDKGRGDGLRRQPIGTVRDGNLPEPRLPVHRRGLQQPDNGHGGNDDAGSGVEEPLSRNHITESKRRALGTW